MHTRFAPVFGQERSVEKFKTLFGKCYTLLIAPGQHSLLATLTHSRLYKGSTYPTFPCFDNLQISWLQVPLCWENISVITLKKAETCAFN